jgi:peptidyl-prolyl cis-trans isomerase C
MSAHRTRFTLRRDGLRLLLAALLALSAAGPVSAETAPQTGAKALVKIGDFALTDLHFALFASQTGRNPADAEGQLSLLNELVNHFMVANSPEGQALAANPEVAAALEVARARLIAQTFVRAQLEAAPIDEGELQKLYATRYGEADGVEFKARHILLEDEATAVAVITELDAGADFAELARGKSTGPSKTVGGDLGWFQPDQMVGPFAAATAELENGAHSNTPVETQFGFHVILREDSRPVTPPTFDAVREELTRELQQQRVAAAITRIRDNTRIEVQTPDE